MNKVSFKDLFAIFLSNIISFDNFEELKLTFFKHCISPTSILNATVSKSTNPCKWYSDPANNSWLRYSTLMILVLSHSKIFCLGYCTNDQSICCCGICSNIWGFEKFFFKPRNRPRNFGTQFLPARFTTAISSLMQASQAIERQNL